MPATMARRTALPMPSHRTTGRRDRPTRCRRRRRQQRLDKWRRAIGTDVRAGWRTHVHGCDRTLRRPCSLWCQLLGHGVDVELDHGNVGWVNNPDIESVLAEVEARFFHDDADGIGNAREKLLTSGNVQHMRTRFVCPFDGL